MEGEQPCGRLPSFVFVMIPNGHTSFYPNQIPLLSK